MNIQYDFPPIRLSRIFSAMHMNMTPKNDSEPKYEPDARWRNNQRFIKETRRGYCMQCAPVKLSQTAIWQFWMSTVPGCLNDLSGNQSNFETWQIIRVQDIWKWKDIKVIVKSYFQVSALTLQSVKVLSVAASACICKSVRQRLLHKVNWTGGVGRDWTHLKQCKVINQMVIPCYLASNQRSYQQGFQW